MGPWAFPIIRWWKKIPLIGSLWPSTRRLSTVRFLFSDQIDQLQRIMPEKSQMKAAQQKWPARPYKLTNVEENARSTLWRPPQGGSGGGGWGVSQRKGDEKLCFPSCRTSSAVGTAAYVIRFVIWTFKNLWPSANLSSNKVFVGLFFLVLAYL